MCQIYLCMCPANKPRMLSRAFQKLTVLFEMRLCAVCTLPQRGLYIPQSISLTSPSAMARCLDPDWA